MIVVRRRRAWGVVLGIRCGTLIWGVLTSLGVTALLTALHLAYEGLRRAGAAYLMWMGGLLLWASWRRSADEHPKTDRADVGRGPRTADDTVLGGRRQGSATSLLNPKTGAFYVAVLPQFVPVGTPHLATGLLLTGVHILLAVCWSCALIAFARVLRGRLQRPSVRRGLDRVTGAAIAVFGIRLVLGDWTRRETRSARHPAHPKRKALPMRPLPAGAESVVFDCDGLGPIASTDRAEVTFCAPGGASGKGTAVHRERRP
ncbi:LysE family translocator [Streptomyces sp. 3213.3]|uniref:LysE family translocator n=1 Tax=Streptomyces sp. 3213.3 TaxID=1855348 RepID=UPI001F26C793|nr:LysE family translocator [Streptomyces sp. 3213.3]